jgi:quinol monooxygenase YgiN
VIVCTTTLSVRAEEVERFEDLLNRLVRDVLAHEPGTPLFQLARSRRNPLTYLVIEQYADKDALEEHSQTGYLKATVPEMLTLLSEPPRLESFDSVA